MAADGWVNADPSRATQATMQMAMRLLGARIVARLHARRHLQIGAGGVTDSCSPGCSRRLPDLCQTTSKWPLSCMDRARIDSLDLSNLHAMQEVMTSR